jgi:phospholipid/cholesterol/gamma-HCH transport system substrate-binding protein
MNAFTVRRRLVGIAFLLVFALLVWLSIALYDKQFTPVALVTLTTGTAGNELHAHADVEARGVVVGEVRSISSTGDGAVLGLAIQPDKVHLLPANVSAELRGWSAAVPSRRTGPARRSSWTVCWPTCCRRCRRCSRKSCPRH